MAFVACYTNLLGSQIWEQIIIVMEKIIDESTLVKKLWLGFVFRGYDGWYDKVGYCFMERWFGGTSK